MREKNTKPWSYLICAIVFSAIVVGLTIWISVPSFGIHFQIDASSVPSNNTAIIGNAPSNTTVVIIDGNVVFAKIALQNIPTVINGITTSTSIIVAFSGAVIGFMIRDLFQSDKKARIAFFGVLLSFIYIFMYLFLVYVFLATGGIDWALRLSLDGLLLSLLIFVWTMLLGSYRLGKTKPDKTEPEKKEREEKAKPESDKEKEHETKKEEYDGRKDLVSKVLEISSLTITIVLGLVTIGQISLERGLRFIIIISSICLASSIFCGVSFLLFAPSYELSKIEPRGTQSNYASEKWTYVSFRNITWKALTRISKSQIIFFFLGMLFLLIALLWRLGITIPFDC